MGRRAKSPKGQAEPKRSLPRAPAKKDSARVRDLEKRLAAALEREKSKDRALTQAHAQVTEALDQQTATSEVLRTIAHAQTDVQPVFETIVGNAARLCQATSSLVWLLGGDRLRVVASYNVPPHSPLEIGVADAPNLFRVIHDGVTHHISDTECDPRMTPKALENSRAMGARAALAVPVRRDREATGAVMVLRDSPGEFTDGQIELLKTFAAQAVIAIENVRLFNETKEALEQQTATSEILRVIASSPTDVRPVFEAILKRAATLCEAQLGHLWLYEGGEQFRLGAGYGSRPDHLQWLQQGLHRFGRPFFRESGPWRVGQVLDVRDTEPYRRGEPVWIRTADHEGMRTLLAVPLVKDGRLVGSIAVYRREVQPFTDQQTALVQTFADQAVIAIENVRLFKELEARNRDLTATSEILQVISRSPTDVQPIFDAIAERAMQLCSASFGAVFMFDGKLIHLSSLANVRPEGVDALRKAYPRIPSQDSNVSRVILLGEVVEIPDVLADPDYQLTGAAAAAGFRSTLGVPMLHQGRPIGVIVVSRPEPGAFSGEQIQLLRTFADQAVIAIENVRLFNETKEALEQQTATSEILRVISQSPTDVQPVFDTIVRSAVRLCDGVHGAILRVDGNSIDHVAQFGHETAVLEEIRRHFPQPIDSANPSSPVRAIRERRIVEVTDTETTPGVPDFIREAARRQGFRSELWVPMLHGENAIGTIGVTRREPARFTDKQVALLKTFADQAVIAIENVRLFTELREKNAALTQAHAQVIEALDQQTATSEVLKVISRSTFDLEPVLQTLIENAVRLCHAGQGVIYKSDGDLQRLAAAYNVSPEYRTFVEQNPLGRDRGTVVGRAMLEGRPIHIHDVLEDPGYTYAGQTIGNYRTILGVPMMREGVSIGVFSVGRAEVLPFTDKQIELVTTFADQGAIAIENVRLFKELEARNNDLTATSEILQAISRSPTDTQPVFDTIAERALNLCSAAFGAVFRFDDGWINIAALTGMLPEETEAARRFFPRRLTPHGRGLDRVARTRELVHIPDVQADPEWRASASGLAFTAAGFRTCLIVPLNREGLCLGAINVWRREAAPFSEQQIELLKTFADQAVIAIENVRLFKELEARNRDLTTALDQQTATAEILRVISQSPTDVQPVFDTIVQSAARLCHAASAGIFLTDGRTLDLPANYGSSSPEALANIRAQYPRPLDRETTAGVAILTRSVIHVPDIEAPLAAEDYTRRIGRLLGVRSMVAVPMMRKGELLGAINLSRREPGGFSDMEVELLKTFADQAVIAIENVRLFKELQARTGELTQSVEQLTALGEISRAVSSTLDVETVLDTIVSRATQLAGADSCAISEYEDATEVFHARATHGIDAALVATLRSMPLRKGEGLMGRAAETREPIQVADIAVPGAYESQVRDVLIGAGFRAVLSVPLLREEQIIGSLSLLRKAPGEFSPEVIEALKTFATQSALAIQNARLFREIEDKGRQLEAASQHKSEFLANMSHELRTPLNAIIGFSEVLNERMFGELNDKQAEYLRDIYASGQHLLSLINDILDLSKIEAGRMELEAADFDLPSAIDNALILIRERATRRGITLGRSIDDRLGMLRGDERKVKQVLLNLLSNALKFTPEGGRIDVSAHLQDGAAEIAVADTGVGIAPEDQEAIFEEFRQVGTADKKVEGTGLGLALSRKFIELHGGRIWVQSKVGKGSTFTFTLPTS